MTFFEDRQNVLMLILAVVVLVAAVVAVVADMPQNEWNPTKLSFDVGGITDAGDVDLSDTQSLYTKKLTKCTGLHIIRAYDAEITFIVFFFDADDRLVSSVVVEGRQYNVERGKMPISEDGRQAVGFRISVVNNDSDATFSQYEAYQMKGKFDVEITTLTESEDE